MSNISDKLILPPLGIATQQPQPLLPAASMLTNSKYTEPWEILKTKLEVTLTVRDRADKAKIVRGMSQLKNLDRTWKAQADNYYLRLRTKVLRTTGEGYLVLKLTLEPSIKYRNGVI
jgi:hypothetical protein